MRASWLLSLPVFVLSSVPVFAQTTVTGRVFDGGGTPIAAANVEVVQAESGTEMTKRRVEGRPRTVVVSARTDAEGSFRLQARQSFAWLQVSSDGFAPKLLTVDDSMPIVVTLTRATLKRGLIKGDGRTVGSARITWVSTDGAEVQTISRPDGTYEAPDPSGEGAQLVVYHPDHAPKTAFVAPGTGSGFNISLEAGVPIRGTAVDSTTRKAIADVDVWVDDVWPMARTDASGAFTIPHAPTTWKSLSGRSANAVGTVERKTDALVLALKPARSVSGTIVETNTRKPLEGVAVSLDTRDGNTVTALTNARGQYTVTGLRPGKYSAQAVRQGYKAKSDTSEEVDLRTALSGRFDTSFTKLPTLEGKVLDDQGRPVAGAFVALGYKDSPQVYAVVFYETGGAITRTAQDGTFVLALPSDEDAEVSPAMKDRPLVVMKQGFAGSTVTLGPPNAKRVPFTVTLGRGVTLRGRVTSQDGPPVVDAAIVLAEDGSIAGSMMPTSAVLASASDDVGWVKSDQNGEFTVQVKEGLHHVSIRKKGYVANVVKRHDPRAGQALSVVLIPALSLKGRITRPDGRGVEGISVGMMPANPTLGAFRNRPPASTDADGAFEIADLAAGTYKLSAAEYERGINESKTVEVPGPDVQIVLPATVNVQGRVLAAGSRNPVADFTARAGSGDYGFHREAKPQGADGSFVFADMPVGPLAFTVSADGYVAREVSDVVLEAGVEPAPLEVLLEADAPVRGRVTNEENKPIDGVTVSVEKVATGREGVGEPAVGDENGEYELRGLPAGPATLAFEADGYVKELKQVDAQKTPVLNVVLKRGLSIKGEVVSAGGLGIPEVNVSVTSGARGASYKSTTSEAQGRFKIEGLVPGRYTITATSRKDGSATLEDVDPESVKTIKLVLEKAKTAILTGKVVGLPDDDDSMVSMVMASSEETEQAGQATIDASRSFRMEDAPSGRITVRAMVSSMGTGGMRSSRSVELTLAPGSQTSTVLEFFDGITLTGTVTKNGAGVPFANLSFVGAGGDRTTVRGDERGAYQAVGLEQGRYQIDVWSENRIFKTTYVANASSAFDIDITGGGIRGHVVRGEGGAPIQDVTISLFRLGQGANTPETSLTTDKQGVFTEQGLVEGRFRLITSKSGFGQEVREIEVNRGAITETTLELKPAEGVNVTVVDARDQRPLEAIVVVRDAERRIVANQHSGVGEDGVFNIPLSAGSYSLSTSATGYGTATLKVSAPAPGLKVGLTPGGTIIFESGRTLHGRVRLLQPDGEEYVRCWCNGIADIELKGKKTVVENVAAGSYMVELIDEPGASPQSVTVVEGQKSTVVLR